MGYNICTARLVTSSRNPSKSSIGWVEKATHLDMLDRLVSDDHFLEKVNRVWIHNNRVMFDDDTAYYRPESFAQAMGAICSIENIWARSHFYRLLRKLQREPDLWLYGNY